MSYNPESEVQIRTKGFASGATLANGHAPAYHPSDDRIDVRPYLLAVEAHWRMIAAVVVTSSAITAVVAGFVLPHWYRASAIIRPISTPAVESRISGFSGGLGGGLAQFGGLGAALGGLGGANDAEEYVAILRGFGLNVSLAKRHQLATKLLKLWPFPLNLVLGWKDPEWGIYRVLQKRFDCEYSIKTGNLTLSYQSRDRREAEQVLGWYISDLRDLLRASEINGATAAIESMEEEARSSPDAILRSQLYELVAKQVQRKKMAQVEADFAFRVLDAPAASDRVYSPNILIDSSLAGVLGALVAVVAIILKVLPTNIFTEKQIKITNNGTSRNGRDAISDSATF